MLLKGFVRNTTVVILMLALLVLTACQPTAAVPVTGIQVAITAQDFTFTVPDNLKSGYTTLVLDNQGKEPHQAQILRLNQGVTMDQVTAALQQGDAGFATLLSLVSGAGGPGVVAPQGKQQVTLNLKPGQHLLVCFVQSPDGVPHVAKGMVKPFTVTDSGSTTQNQAAEPASSLTVNMKDFAFDIPAQVKAGTQTWKIVNNGPQLHELTLVKLNQGTTFQDLQNMMGSNQSGPPPFTEAGGMQALSAGDSGWLTLNLEPGEYAAFCFVPDLATGKAHVELGMMEGFTVQ